MEVTRNCLGMIKKHGIKFQGRRHFGPEWVNLELYRVECGKDDIQLKSPSRTKVFRDPNLLCTVFNTRRFRRVKTEKLIVPNLKITQLKWRLRKHFVIQFKTSILRAFSRRRKFYRLLFICSYNIKSIHDKYTYFSFIQVESP